MRKMLVFDMDGTIADLYSVHGWLEDLCAYNPRPYIKAKPLYDMEVIVELLSTLKSLGWEVAVTSWLSKDSSPVYDELVTQAKLEWLAKYNFPYDIVNIVPYGTEKSTCTMSFGGTQILVDDNAEVRSQWTLGSTINAEHNIIAALVDLIVAEF